ncbi:hypothetical protein JD844_021284 [Phrynosoma platyrhinos]|uniref:BHLH domain-containing protein n=1 Tax=Phrynosoma platyrhinos TaxID=52577 RepID=A0ABQ7STI4_PHRPL|nr:hypothetical protein JD844_021284 [Phrynosoma platyrhinos]
MRLHCLPSLHPRPTASGSSLTKHLRRPQSRCDNKALPFHPRIRGSPHFLNWCTMRPQTLTCFRFNLNTCFSWEIRDDIFHPILLLSSPVPSCPRDLLPVLLYSSPIRPRSRRLIVFHQGSSCLLHVVYLRLHLPVRPGTTFHVTPVVTPRLDTDRRFLITSHLIVLPRAALLHPSLLQLEANIQLEANVEVVNSKIPTTLLLLTRPHHTVPFHWVRTTSPPSFLPGAEKRMGPRLLLIPVHPGSPTLRPQNMQLAQGKRMILQPLRNPGGVNLYRHPNGQIIQLVPLHQLQTTGPQPSLPPVMLRNSGSVVGIRLPAPSKTPETSVCQPSPVSSVIQTTTTSVLSVTPSFSEHTTTEITSVLPETSTTMPTSPLPSTPTIQVPSMSLPLAVVSTPRNIEAASLLSMPCTSETPLLPISPLPTSIPPTSEGLSVVSVSSTSDVPLLLPVPPPPVPASSATESSSPLPKQPITEGPSVLSAPITIDAPFLLPTTEAQSVLPQSTTTVGSSVLPVSSASQGPTTRSRSAATQDSSVLSVPPVADIPLVSSATPVTHTTEVPSTLSTSITNCTLKAITSMPVCPVSATQAVPAISPVFVPVSQTGTLTLRICPSGIKSNTTQMISDSKIKCSSSGQPKTTDNLISLESGSFALLQFPVKKNIPSPAMKQVASLESKKNEFSAITLEENITNSQVVGTMESKENKLPANQPEFHAEELTCDQNGDTFEKANKDAKLPLQSHTDVSSNPAYTSEDKNCEEKEVIVKRKHVKNPEESQGKVLYSYDTVPESCSETAVFAHSPLEEEKVEQLKTVCEEQTHFNQAQNPNAGIKGIEQTHLDTEKRMITEWPHESWSKHEVNIDSTMKLPNKFKPLLWETQDPVPLESNMKEKDNSVVDERKTEELREKPKITSVEVQDNASANKNLDNAQEFLPERNIDCQDNDKTSRHIKEAADSQEESQTTNLVQVSKISEQLFALEYKTNMDADKHIEKIAKCIQQNTLKTSHHRKDSPPIIDITMDDTEKEEKTDDSADEMVDEISGYQSEDVNIETMDESESSGVEEQVDIETVEELSEKINIARLKATATHALLAKQLHLVRDYSNKVVAKTAKQPESSNKKPKNAEETFANYRQTHTANERRRRKEMRGLFEKLKATLGLQAFPKVSKCFILKQAFEEIQGLTDQADKLKGQKNLLMRKQDALIRKISALSGKAQEVVLKKLEYIYAKQKAVEEQKKKQHQQAEPKMICDNIETARTSMENSSSSAKEMKPVIVPNKRAKPLILSRKGDHVTGDTSSHMTLTNASLVMTANGQVLAFRTPLVPGQFASQPSTLLQSELKSEIDCTNGATQPGTASVMIQLPSSAVPVQVKSILPTSTLPITLSSVVSSTANTVVQKAPDLTSESEDSFMMPRIVNVTSLANKEDTNLNLDINKNSCVTLHASSHESEPSFQVLSQETDNLPSEGIGEASSGKGRNATGTAQDFLGRKNSFPQIVNVSSLKGSSTSFATNLCTEDFSGTKKRTKQMGKGGDCQKSKNSSFQKLQGNVPRDSGLEMELQKVASVIHQPTLDPSDLIDIEESDDADETLTSLLNEIAFLNQQLNDDASDISELPNSLSSGFPLGDVESHRESATANASPFQFGAMGGTFKDLSVGRESTDSITPLLLHLDDDDLSEGSRKSGDVSAQTDALKLMLRPEVKNPHPDLTAINRDENRKNVSLTKARSVSPPILQMKTNLEVATTDMGWRPMPKLAPLGLKAANFSLDSEGQNTRMMPLLAPVAAKEMKTAEPMSCPNLDPKPMLTLASAAKKSK